MKKNVFSAFIITLLLCGASPIFATTYFVKTTGNNSLDGKSWANAKKNIDSALSVAVNSDQIFVALGTYVLTGTINMKNGVNVYGGFNGFETTLAQRPALIYGYTEGQASILDGNNQYQVLKQPSSFTDTTIWNGFDIKRGYSSVSNGGGVYLMNKVKLINCSITENHTYYSSGGGVFCSGSILMNCYIANNTSNSSHVYGGGAYCSNSTLINCEINNNKATSTYASSNSAGGVYCSSSTFINCNITNNAAFSYSNSAAGVYCSSDNKFTNCTIANNTSSVSAGADGAASGILCTQGSNNNIFTKCIMSNNSSIFGSCIVLYGQGSSMKNCTVINNKTSQGSTIICIQASILNCNIVNNTAGDGSGSGCINCNQGVITNCNIVNNISKGSYGGVYCSQGVITNCIIWRNMKKLGDEFAQITGTPEKILYSAIQGGYTGTENINI